MSDSSPQVVLFDWEGTLVDFQWNLQGAVRDAKAELRRLGLDPATWEDNYATLRNRAIQSGKPGIAQRIDAIYDRYDADAASRWSLQSATQAQLALLKSEHVKIGLVSNIGRKTIGAVLPRLGLAHHFQVIITRDDVGMLKPSGEGIRRALERLECPSAGALFVGDSISDVLAAQDAGIKVAIVQGGESAPVSLRAACPDYLWNSLDELAQVFRR